MMKQRLTHLLMIASLLFSVATYATETYKLDPMHSYVLWHVNHFGFSHPSGKWFANGTLELDKNNPQNDKVNVTIDVADIDTGIKELDDHLKGKLFFDTAQFPKATFVSNKVVLTSKDTAKVQGILTVHGISKPVTLSVKLNKMGMNPISDKMSVGFSATTQVKRSDFGINTLLPGLGDEVTLNIEAEAYKVS
jgi:polyisoprenoid-binding protein YceI